jgi:phosphoglycerate kinase
LQDAPVDIKKKGLDYVEVADHIVTDNLGNRLLKDGYIPLPKIIYPVDVVAAKGLDSSKAQVVDLVNKDKICNRCDLMYLDIGPKTVRLYRELILQAETVFWNGPMGVFEKKPFARGTREVARAVAKTGALTLVGGGDTIEALDRFHYYKSVDYVSMAGSAALDFLSGNSLPGVEVLKK